MKQNKYTVKKDVIYSQALPDICRLDLYLPESENPCPAVLLVHGGGWRAGNKEQWAQLGCFLAERGFACASATYRLAPNHTFPAQIEDVRLAMAWVKTNGPAYGMDVKKIGAVGSSAGGHLVALLSTIGPEDSLGITSDLKVRDTRPSAVVCYNPITNFFDQWAGMKPSLKEAYVQLFGGTRDEKEDLYRLASPALRLTGEEPPFLFLQGTEDVLTPKHIPEDMARRLKEKGISAELVMFEDMKHGFAYELKHGEQIRAAHEVAKFLKQYLDQEYLLIDGD